MGHGLRGEELERVYQQTQAGSDPVGEAGSQSQPEESSESGLAEVPTSTEQERSPAEDREPVERNQSNEHGDRVSEAVDRLRRAKHRLQTARERTGKEVEREKESPGFFGKHLGFNLLGQTETETTVERTEAERELCRECQEEVEAAERELEKALEHEQIERRYQSA
jgi:exonuclease VII small subunit